MQVVRMVSVLGFISMSIAIGYGLIVGDFLSDGAEILANPWGVVSLVDLYVGFVLFSLWIVFREQSVIRSIVWVVAMMVFGFWTASLYLLIASFRAPTVTSLLLGGREASKKSVS